MIDEKISLSETGFQEKIIKQSDSVMPKHVAVIMDGNGRWALKKGLSRSEGHVKGAAQVPVISEYFFSRGVKTVSLYALSEENFSRPKNEVNGIIDRITEFIAAFPRLFKRLCGSVRLCFSGERDRFGEDFCKAIENAERETALNLPYTLNILLGYGGRTEIIRAARLLSENGEPFTEDNFKKYLYHGELPDPDLIIRTGGDVRLSGFMPFQSTYSELYFCKTLFPEFGAEQAEDALNDYSLRKRKYGKVE